MPPSEQIICTNCGSIDDYTIRETGGVHQSAFCNACEKFIRHLPHKPQQFYFGKYKGQLVSDVDDIPYLTWFFDNTNPRPAMRSALSDQLKRLRKDG